MTVEALGAVEPVGAVVPAPSAAVVVAVVLLATSGRVSGVKLSVPVVGTGSLEVSFAVVIGSTAAGSAALVGVWTSGIDMVLAGIDFRICDFQRQGASGCL